MKILNTFAGSEIIFFTDRHGNECTLQQSSPADYEASGASAIWLGTGEDRMHIGLEQLIELMPHLQQWVKTGSFHLTCKS